DRYPDDLLGPGVALIDRPLGLGRKGRDGVDPGLDFIEHLEHVVVLIDLDLNASRALAPGGDDFLDAVDVLYRLFDLDQHALLDVAWRAAAVGHGDGDVIGLDLRLNFLGDRERRGHAAGKQAQHQQVGRHRVVGE